jgi:hypothetical protein
MPSVIGQRRKATCTFKNDDGELVDPTTVIVTYRKGRSAAEVTKTFPTNAEVVRESLGVFYILIDQDQGGYWYARFEGTGALVAAQEIEWEVAVSAFTNP